MAIVLLFFFITFLSGFWPRNFEICITRNHEETYEIRKFEKAIWELNFDTMGYVWMGRWKYRKHKIFLCFNRGHCFTYQNHSEQADCCRNNWWHKKLSLFSTKWSNKAWAIYRVSWWDIDCLKIGHYLAAVYEGQWYPSLILEINWDQRDLLVKSLHNSGYDKNCFFWPPRDDIYYVPFTHIIGLTEVPNIVGDMDKTVTKSVQNCLNYLTKI